MKKPSPQQFTDTARPRTKRRGISLVEILVSLSIFSIGIIGLYLSIQSMNRNLATAMQRDVEAAYANMLISQVNLHDLYTETAYDTSGATKIQVTLPDGRSVWYLRRVDSDTSPTGTDGTPVRADLKYIHIYFYRNQSDPVSTPYRHFKREVPLLEQYYDMRQTATSGASAEVCKDASGRLYIPVAATSTYSLTPGSVQAGTDNATMGGNPTVSWQTANGGNVDNSVDTYDSGWVNCEEHEAWRSTHARNPLVYKFPVSEGKNYEVMLGFNEFDTTNVDSANDRVIQVQINGTTVDNAVDVYDKVGYYEALTKTYSAKGVADTNGIYTITVRLNQNGGSQPPRISWIGLRQAGGA